MAEIAVRASEEVRRQLEPWLERLGRLALGGAPMCLVERGFQGPDTGLVVLFGREDLPGLERLLRAAPGPESAAGSVVAGELLTGRRGSTFTLLPVREIRCFGAEGDVVSAELPDGPSEVEPRLYEVEAAYRAKGFIRIAKSLIVNVSWVAEIIPWLGGRLVLVMKGDGARLEVSRSYVADFRRFLGMGGNR
jgi:two-component system LytT family response regulator